MEAQENKTTHTPSRLRTLPVMTLSGRSIVFATASTMSLLPARVGQLKKLYTTSCFVVKSWSSSSIRMILRSVKH